MSNGTWTWSPEPESGGGSDSLGHVPPSHVSPGSAPGPFQGAPPVAPLPAAVPEPTFASQLTVAMPGARPGIETWPLEGAPVPRRRRTGLWVGVGLGVVALVGVAVAGWVLVGSKLVAPASPTAAVDRLFDGVTHKDGLAVLGSLSPAEMQPFRQAMAEMSHDVGTRTADPASAQAFTDAFDSLTVSVDGLQLQQQTLDDGLAKVSITAGVVTFDGDPESIADAVVAAVGEHNPVMTQDATAMHDEIVGSLAGTLPYTVDLAREGAVDGHPPYLVTVREGRGWYVSPLMTLGEYATASEGLTRGAMPHDVDVAHPASPKAAAAQLAAAIPALVRGDSDALVAVLPEAERRFVAVYLQPALDEATANGEAPEITLTDGEFEVADQTADRAFVVTTNLAYALVLNGVSGTVSFDGDCLTSQSDDASGVFHGCISDAPLLTELGLDHPALVTVHENGGWYVSLIGTFAELSRTVGDNLERLQQEGKLDDPEWLQQNFGPAVGLLGLGAAYDEQAGSEGTADGTGLGDWAQEPGDPQLDELQTACLGGDMLSCDWLYASAPSAPDGDLSEYQVVGGTCGYAVDFWMAGACVQEFGTHAATK